MDLVVEDILKQLKIVEIRYLYTHEEVIPTNLFRLKEAMLNIGQLVDPLIVDIKTQIVLDGNHRITVLKMIKCPRAVCQMVDYKNPSITVGTWIPSSDLLSLEELKSAGLHSEPVDFELGLNELNNKKAPFLFVKKVKGVKKSFLINPSSYSLDELVEEQRKIMNKLNSESFRYLPDNEADDAVESGKAVLYRKVYTKEEIIDRAHRKKPFPPKSTRHLVPNRIIRLNMRLGWLHQEEKEATEYLERMLSNRVYNGNVRRYLEPVIVIY